jgi:hypothetical protein
MLLYFIHTFHWAHVKYIPLVSGLNLPIKIFDYIK